MAYLIEKMVHPLFFLREIFSGIEKGNFIESMVPHEYRQMETNAGIKMAYFIEKMDHLLPVPWERWPGIKRGNFIESMDLHGYLTKEINAGI